MAASDSSSDSSAASGKRGARGEKGKKEHKQIGCNKIYYNLAIIGLAALAAFAVCRLLQK